MKLDERVRVCTAVLPFAATDSIGTVRVDIFLYTLMERNQARCYITTQAHLQFRLSRRFWTCFFRGFDLVFYAGDNIKRHRNRKVGEWSEVEE